MKKNEDAAAKKKPKTSAAQIRVQKGARSFFAPAPSHTPMLMPQRRLDGAGPPIDDEDTLC